MPSPEMLERFIARVERNAHAEAVEEFYTENSSMRENQAEPRVGRELHVANERKIFARAKSVRSEWLLRTLVIILIIGAGAAVGAAIGDWVQPDLYIFNGSLTVPLSAPGTDMAVAKQAHITAIRGNIPAAAATLNAQGIRISAAEFGNRMTLKDVPQTRLISIQCTSRSFNTPLAMVHALIVPYCNNVPGVT